MNEQISPLQREIIVFNPTTYTVNDSRNYSYENMWCAISHCARARERSEERRETNGKLYVIRLAVRATSSSLVDGKTYVIPERDRRRAPDGRNRRAFSPENCCHQSNYYPVERNYGAGCGAIRASSSRGTRRERARDRARRDNSSAVERKLYARVLPMLNDEVRARSTDQKPLQVRRCYVCCLLRRSVPHETVTLVTSDRTMYSESV